MGSAGGRSLSGSGCAQLGVSRAKHLQALKEAFPDTETLLTRAPVRGDLEATARYVDLSLIADTDVLTALNEEAEKWGNCSGIILMLDVGGLQEGRLRLTAGIVEIHEKASAPKVSFTKNWVGSCIVFLYEGDSAKTRRTHCPKGMSIVSNTVLSVNDSQ